MAESYQEKTEKATPRRLREAREKGEIARSVEINSAVVLLVGMLALRFFGSRLLMQLIRASQWIFSRLSYLEFTPENVFGYSLAGMKYLAFMLAPIVLMVMIAGLGANVAQGGLVFAGEPIKPKMSKINPVEGFKKIVSMRSLVELVKGLMKLAMIGTIGYVTIKSELYAYPYLMDKDVSQIVAFVTSIGYKIAFRAALALLLMAVLDYAYQRFEFEKKLRMTKQEVKEEYKRSEGDPLIKARIRSIQMKQARQRMLSAVKEADVVVTNPIHLAVALKYESRKMQAPKVVAKGARLIAEKIKEAARKHDVPVIENKPLAQVLYKTVEIGFEIPYDLYRAVAEILAYVYRIKKNIK